MIYEYLIFNILIFLSPIIGGILYKKTLWPNFKIIVLAVLFPAIIYIIGDIIVTDYFWYFNKNYILGIKIFKLPIEEILFFITVPFASLFLWHNWQGKIKKNIKLNYAIIIIAILLLSIIFLFWQEWYSGIILVILCLCFIVDKFYSIYLFKRLDFLLFLLLVIVLTLIFNGYLTARPIVLYNHDLKSNINIGTVPIEDVFYGISLVYANCALYNYLSKKLAASKNKIKNSRKIN